MKIKNYVVILSLPFIMATFAYATVMYSYDPAGRLANVDYGNDKNIVYTYDIDGNMLQRNTSGSARIYTLTYMVEAGGHVDGVVTQFVEVGASGSAVTAIPATGVTFYAWSDDLTVNPRTDTNITSNITVRAIFHSQGGADLEWYNQYGFGPGAGEEWSSLDAFMITNKGTTLLQEYISDTNPNDPNDVLCITTADIASSNSMGITICFPSSANRQYFMTGCSNLLMGIWNNIPGADPRMGTGGMDSMQDTNVPMRGPFYQINVSVPE